MLKERVLHACRARSEEFESLLEPFEDQGILPSEMLAVCAVAEALGAEVVIESGRQRGHSTMLLAKYFEGRSQRVISVERHRDEVAEYAEARLGGFERLELLYGDGTELIPELAGRLADTRVAILMDGPKGEPAVRAARAALARSENVVALFFHDAAPGSETRQLVERWFARSFFTDDADFVREFEPLDERCKPQPGQALTEHTWRPYAWTEAYGPTLAVVEPTAQERELLPAVRLGRGESAPERLARRARTFVRMARAGGPGAAVRHGLIWARRAGARRRRRRDRAGG